MRIVAILIVTALGPACSKAEPRRSVQEEQDEAFGRSYVAITTSHPRSMTAIRQTTGVEPASCAIEVVEVDDRNAYEIGCDCAWRYLTPTKTKEIHATGTRAIPDEKDALLLPDVRPSVVMLGRDGKSVDVPGDEVRAAYCSGKYGLPHPDDTFPIATAEGKVGRVRAAELMTALDQGARLVSRREEHKAYLDQRYGETGVAAIQTCVSEKTRVIVIQLDTDEPIMIENAAPPRATNVPRVLAPVRR